MFESIKKRYPLLLAFIVIYAFFYIILELYKESRVNEILDEQEMYLDISYKQGLDRFETIGHNIYLSMQNDIQLIELVANTDDANLEESHAKIYAYLQQEFKKLQLSGVMGIQIVTPQSKSIIRMHAKERFGDDLSSVRPMIVELNKQKVHLHGFEEGKTSHAFREAYPLYKDGVYIGGVEILFSSTKLQDYTIRASNIHTHFIVDRNVFKTNEWKSNSQDPYGDSIEHKDYLFSVNDHIKHDVMQSSSEVLIKPLREEIDRGFLTGESFHVYRVVNYEAKAIVFLAVKRFIDKKTVAYLVSYTNVGKLYDLVVIINIIQIGLLVFLLIAYLVATSLLSQKERVLNELKYDDLTRVHTRKYFVSLLQQKEKKVYAKGAVFCVVMADIDYFKNVNDTYGHQYGDTVLKEFATILKESTRSMDLVARYGGEEFIIMMNTNIKNAYAAIEAIRLKVENHSFGPQNIKVTASFGISEFKGQEDEKLHELIAKADSALYEAKTSGRNQTKIA